MIKIKECLVAVMAVVMVSCSSDEEPKRISIDKFVSEIPAEHTAVEYCGASGSTKISLLLSENTVEHDAMDQYRMVMQFDDVKNPVLVASQTRTSIYPSIEDKVQIPIVLQGDETSMTVQGELEVGLGTLIAEGVIENITTARDCKVKIKVHYEAAKSEIAGKTYQINFDENGLKAYASLYDLNETLEMDSTSLNAPEVLDWFYCRVRKAIERNAGADGAKIRFKEDGTMDVWFLNAENNTCEHQEYEFRYYEDKGEVYLYVDDPFMDHMEEVITLTDDILGVPYWMYCYADISGRWFYGNFYRLSIGEKGNLHMQGFTPRQSLRRWSHVVNATYPNATVNWPNISDEYLVFSWLNNCVYNQKLDFVVDVEATPVD